MRWMKTAASRTAPAIHDGHRSPGLRSALMMVFFVGVGVTQAARAELSEIHVAQQYGIGYLPLMIMEEQKLIEKYAKATGVDVSVS